MLDAQTKANEGLINDPDDDIINKMADMSLAKPSKYLLLLYTKSMIYCRDGILFPN